VAEAITLRERVQQVREDAILATVNRLLAQKGYEAMTVDEVAASVGMAKASLYKHFASKESLAAAAMTRMLDRALEVVESLRAEPGQGGTPVERLRAVVRWAMTVQLEGEMPTLPSQNSTLRAALLADNEYIDRLSALSEALGEWIVAAQAEGDLNADLPPELMLYTIYARACDPVLALLKAGGNYPDAALIEMLLTTCFEGIAARR
jgi:AcrR family transcriptional regulator